RDQTGPSKRVQILQLMSPRFNDNLNSPAISGLTMIGRQKRWKPKGARGKAGRHQNGARIVIRVRWWRHCPLAGRVIRAASGEPKRYNSKSKGPRPEPSIKCGSGKKYKKCCGA